MNLINEAKFFAIGAHEAIGQKRKYTNEPYWHHSQEVADLTSYYIDLKNHEIAVAAAWLHDVVEDTQVKLGTIKSIFDLHVEDIIYYLTDKSKPEDGNRDKRKSIDREHISKGCKIAQTIKCADLISNTKSIVRYDKNFSIIYLKEKELLLEVLTKAQSKIRERAYAVLRKAQKDLNLFYERVAE